MLIVQGWAFKKAKKPASTSFHVNAPQSAGWDIFYISTLCTNLALLFNHYRPPWELNVITLCYTGAMLFCL